MKILNKNEIAQAFNTSLPTIDSWIRKGMPCVEQGGNGKAWQFNLSDCIRWHKSTYVKSEMPQEYQNLPLAKARAYKEFFKAKLAEMEYERETGKLLLASEVSAWAAKAAGIVKDKLYNIAPRMSSILAAESSEFEVNRLLTKEIEDVLWGLHHEFAKKQTTKKEEATNE